MTAASIDLGSLARRLDAFVSGRDPALTVRVTNGGKQLTITPAVKGVRQALARKIKKDVRQEPDGAAFELYISVETQQSTQESQRVLLPAEPPSALVLDADTRDRVWTVAAPTGEHIVIRLALGEQVSHADANRLLELIRNEIW